MSQLQSFAEIESSAISKIPVSLQPDIGSKQIKILSPFASLKAEYIDSYKILALVNKISSKMRDGSFKLFVMTRDELNLFDLSAKKQKTLKFFEAKSVAAIGLITASTLIGAECTEGVAKVINGVLAKTLPVGSQSLSSLLGGSDQKEKSDQQLIQMELETLKEQKRSSDEQAKSLQETSSRICEKLEAQKHLLG